MLSFCYIATVYNGWLYRFSYYFYLPVGLFFASILRNAKNKGNKWVLGSIVIGLLFILTYRFVVLTFVNNNGF